MQISNFSGAVICQYPVDVINAVYMCVETVESVDLSRKWNEC